MLRIGHGYDVHRLVEGRDLILGGVKIPFTLGLLGHSDADVLIHSLCDALLGAAALGDIGKHFPDNNDDFKDIDSRILLRNVIGLLKEKGYKLVNADITIIAQKPKLSSYINDMICNIAFDCSDFLHNNPSIIVILNEHIIADCILHCQQKNMPVFFISQVFLVDSTISAQT